MKNKNLFIGLVFVFILGFIFLVIKTVEKDPSGFNIICMGDSLTESEFGYYPRHLLGLLKRQGFKANVYSAAQTGNTSGEYLDFLRRSNLLKKIRPDLVILMLGTNDVRVDRDHTPLHRYKNNISQIIQLIKRRSLDNGSDPIIFIASIPPIQKIDLHPFDETSKIRVKEEIVPAIKNLAREENIFFIDIFTFFKKRPELMSGIHPRKKGYYAMAEYILGIILPFLGAK